MTQQGTINNACFIDVDTEINIKYLNLASNSSIECDYIIINNTTLRASSILRSRVFGAQNADWKFVGETETGRALISSEIVEYIHNGGVNIIGPIYFETNGYSETGASNGGLTNEYQNAIVSAYANNNTTGAGCGVVGSAPFLIIPDGFYDDTDISKADCVGHGNIPAEFAEIVDRDIQWVVAFEDLGSTGDYDFNDAVFKVSHVAGSNQLTVTPLAAGGTYSIEVRWNGNNISKYIGDGTYNANNENLDFHQLINSNASGKNGLWQQINDKSKGKAYFYSTCCRRTKA